MSFYTLFDIKQAVSSNLPGNGISQIKDFFQTFDKGRRAMIARVRPEELVRKTYLEDALYPNVDQYAVPEDMKYDDVIEIKRLAGYRNVDTMEHPLEIVYRRRFGQKRGSAANVMNIGYENGIKFARIFRPSGGRYPVNNNSNPCTYLSIQNCDSLSENGTWNVAGNVVNLREDKLLHVIGRGSLQFDINDSATTGSLTNFTLTPFDLFHFLTRGAVFNWLNITQPKELVAVKISMGSNSADLTTDFYYTSVNSGHDTSAFISGWNLLKYMLRNLNRTGTPNPRALTWIQIEFTTTGKAIPNCNIDNIVAREGSVYEMTYNSSYVVRDAINGGWKKVPTKNSDIIVSEEDTYNLLVDEITLAAQREAYINSPGASAAMASIATVLEAKYKKFSLEHKSEGVLAMDSQHIFGNMYDGYTDDPEVGFGNQYGQYGDFGSGIGSFGP